MNNSVCWEQVSSFICYVNYEFLIFHCLMISITILLYFAWGKGTYINSRMAGVKQTQVVGLLQQKVSNFVSKWTKRIALLGCNQCCHQTNNCFDCKVTYMVDSWTLFVQSLMKFERIHQTHQMIFCLSRTSSHHNQNKNQE